MKAFVKRVNFLLFERGYESGWSDDMIRYAYRCGMSEYLACDYITAKKEVR